MRETAYLIDGDELSRRMLALELSAFDLEPWPFPSLERFLAMLPHLEPAPVVLSGHPAGMNGLAHLSELARRVSWPILLIGERGDFRTAYDALRLGALEFVERPIDPLALGEAFSEARAMLSRILAARDLTRRAEERLARLTPRELQVGLALIGGLGNKGVAHRLGISVRTVEMHRARLLMKLEVRNLAEGALLLSQARPPDGEEASGRPHR